MLRTVSLSRTNINTDILTAWMVQNLLPKLPQNSAGVVEHAAFDKGASMKQQLFEAGHTLLYLPPYSLDLNPIERKWARNKIHPAKASR